MSEEATATKVGRLLEAYDLGEDYGAAMAAAWTADGDDRTSLRDLADEFNKDLLAAALREADAGALAHDVERTYHLLTDDDVTAGQRTEVRRRLEREGVDVERLESDFVTHQAVRSYLTGVRDAVYEPAETDAVERSAETVGRLRSRLEQVAESNVARLRDTGRLDVGDVRLLVDVDVLCTDCGAQYPIEELLDRGGCDCESAE